MDRLIGLVGLGYWGKNILRNLYNLSMLHTACDLDQNVVRQRKEGFPDIKYTTSIETILRNPEIKAVAIATPAATHYELVKKSLLAGKDVFVEKPLALKVSEGEELLEIAARRKRILMVGHVLQYHPAVIKLKELISSGTLGKIQYIYSNRLNIGMLRTEENILWSFAPHDISVILMLLEEEPIKVSAIGGAYLNGSIYDTTLTTLEFRNGTQGHVFVSWLHPFKEQKLIIVGSRAMVVFNDMTDEKLFIYPHKVEWISGKIPVARKKDYRVIPLPKEEPLKCELTHFFDCVLSRKQPKTDGAEGLRVLKILEFSEESLLKGEKVRLRKNNAMFFVHESAFIDEAVDVGRGTKIWHFSHISNNSFIGKDCILGQNVSIGPDVVIGNNCKIQNNVSIPRGVRFEDEVSCGPSCAFTDSLDVREVPEMENEKRCLTLVKRGAVISANTTIACGVTIGRFAVIEAGSVLKSDVPDYAVFAGVPARGIGWICQCGITLNVRENQAVCSCGKKYEIKGERLLRVPILPENGRKEKAASLSTAI